MMNGEQSELDELSREIRRLIDENKKFLDKVRGDEFEAEEEAEDQEPPEIEL